MSPIAEQRDEALAELIDQLLRDARRGQHPDIEAVALAHPELADDLRELWSTAQFAEEFALLTRTMAGSDSIPVIEPEPSLQLPRAFGEYILLEEIGRGGMGIVYRARQQSPDRVVALKMILRGEWASDGDVARFHLEAEAAAQLHHPHIVPVYEVGQTEGRPYFSMQLITGSTLAKRLADGPLAPRVAAELLIPVCRAIAEAHRRGVLHRDLKPSNILLDEQGRTYVTDFGLAKRVATNSLDDAGNPSTATGAVLGTPSYMAPEQAAGQRGVVTPQTDVYSLGAILYAMLTGRPPFQAASALDTVLMVLEQDPVPPRLLNSKADPDLEMIALKCLQKPADLRYASADALADDLQAYLANEPIEARSGQFLQIITRALRETHHAAVLENWGLLWMWHSLVVLSLCIITNGMAWQGIVMRWPYATLWSIGVGAWALIFWELRRRSGPITFVERQIAHVWAGSGVCSSLLFGLEALLELPALTLSPVLPLIAGNVFLVKAGILSGTFYIQAVALYLTAFVMATTKQSFEYDPGLSIFGFVLAGCFFMPGLKYYRLRAAGRSVNL